MYKIDFGRKYGDEILWNGGVSEPYYRIDRKIAIREAKNFLSQSSDHRTKFHTLKTK
jgi:hypothetical protein